MDTQQKIMISTNIAETGITFKNLTYVIDSAKYKSIYYNPNKKMTVMRDLPICKNMM